MRVSTLTLAIAALGVSIAGASAQPQVRAGLLQCQGGQNVGFVVGSVTSFQCVFQSEGRRPEPYLATVRRYGVDLGFTDQTRLVWGVNAHNAAWGSCDLAGQLWRRRRQRLGRRRLRRQFPGRRSGKSLCAAAGQRAGPDRSERRGRGCGHSAGAGPVRPRRQASPTSQATSSHGTSKVRRVGPRKWAFFCPLLFRHEPGLSRPFTSSPCLNEARTWMPGTSPGMTSSALRPC